MKKLYLLTIILIGGCLLFTNSSYAQSTIVVDASSTNYTGCNTNNGTVSATPAGGDGLGSGYNVYLTGVSTGAYPGNPVFILNGATAPFSGLLADNYTVQVYDEDDDPNTFGSGTYGNSQPDLYINNECVGVIVVNASSTNYAGCNTNNGTVSATPTGGDANNSGYNVYLTGVSTGAYPGNPVFVLNGATAAFSGLLADNYTMQVYDEDDDPNTFGSGTYGNSQPDLYINNECVGVIVVNASSTNYIGCNTNNGTVSATPTGGDANNSGYNVYLTGVSTGAYPGNPVFVLNGATAAFSGLLADNYTVQVYDEDDDPNTFGSGTYGNSQPDLYINNECVGVIVVNASSTNYAGCNTNNGTVSATPTGGDANNSGYNVYLTGVSTGAYPGNPVFVLNGATAAFSGLLADNYTVQVYDEDDDPNTFGSGTYGNSQSDLYVNNECVGVIVVNASSTNYTDCNSNDGTVSATPTGGDANNSGYNVYLTGVSTGIYPGNPVFILNGATASFSGLLADNYTVQVYDEDDDPNTFGSGTYGNSQSGLIVTVSNPVAPTISKTDITCNNADNGTVTITAEASGGVGPYTYSIDGLNYFPFASTPFTGLSAGPYTVYSQDANLCAAPVAGPVTVTNPSPVAAPTISKTDITCNNADNGMVTITAEASGGVGPYTYSIDGGATYVAFGATPFTGLSAGPYTVLSQDANLCAAPAAGPVTVTNPSPVAAPTISKTDITCNNADNGIVTITAEASGGVGPYTYSIDGGVTYVAFGATPFTGLSAGPYTVLSQDANLCAAPAAGPVTVTNPSTVAAPTISKTDITCNNADNGMVTITAEASGGVGPYTYSIDGGATYVAFGATPFTGLSAGPYTVLSQDANLCAAPAAGPVTVTNPSPVAAPTISKTDITCNNADNGMVTITAEASGGVGPYTYSIDGGATYVAFGATPFTGLSAGPYTVLSQDANLCAAPAAGPVTVTNPSPVAAPTISKTDITCNNADNGIVTITVEASGGVGPYTYSIDGLNYFPFASTPFTGLSAGPYTVYSQDANLCSAPAAGPVTVTNPSPVAAPTISKTDITCNNADNGIVTITAEASGGVGPYTYSIDGLNYFPFASTPFTGLSAGPYTVYSQDANLCAAPTAGPVTITNPSPVAAPTISKTDITCNNADNGIVTITVEASGGVGPYTYSIDGLNYFPFASTPFTGLSAGPYTVYSQDANLCAAPTAGPVTVNNPAPVTAPVISETDVTCTQQRTVTINSQSTGGVGPYTYSIDGINYVNFAATPFTGLAANTYSVLGQDANGCISPASNSVTVNNLSTVIAPVISATDITCNGANNGIVTISSQSSGGTGPYTYSIDGINYVNFATTPFTGLPANTYSVLGKDANGCISPASNSVTVNEPTAIAAPVVAETDITCNGANNGIVTISSQSSGGTSPYTYSIDGINYVNFVATPFTGLSANTYSVLGQDANGCISPASNNVTVTEPAIVAPPVITETDITCNGADNGIVTIQTPSSGGVGPYKYSIDGTNYYNITNFMGLSANNYTVLAKDANGCLSLSSNSVTVNNPSVVNAPVISETDITCNGAGNGVVTIITPSSGGVGPYTYSVDGFNYLNTSSFSPLPANTYSVLGKDANGCISPVSNNVTVNQPSAVTAPVVSETDVTCTQQGTVTINSQSTGGVGTYTYSIDGINYVNFAATPFTGLTANTYSVLGKDGNGCISPASNSVTINNSSSVIAPVVSETDITCNGAGNGTVTISAQSSGGTAPYTYSIDGINYVNFATTPFTGLTANTYSVTGKDASGCISPASNSVTMNEPTVVAAPVVTETDITCNGAGNGTVIISAQSSGGTGPYTYSINGVNYVNFAATPFTGLSANTYSVLGKDANGCISPASNNVTVNEPSAVIAPVITETDITCNNANNGIVTIQTPSSGGVGPYRYSIDGTNYYNITNFMSLSANSYTVSAEDANGCLSSPSNNVTVNNPSVVNAPAISETDITCNGAGNGVVTIITPSSGGVGPYTYSVDGFNYLNTSSFSPLPANTYSVLGKDANGCISAASNSVTVNQPSAVTAPVVSETDVTCTQQGTVTINSQSTGGVGTYTYSIDGVNYVNFAATPFTGLTANTYSVLGKDGNGCISPASNSVTINNSSSVIAPVVSETDITCNGAGNGTVTISAQSSGGTAPYTYSIDGINYVNFATTPFTGLTANTYSVTGKDASGCISAASNSVTVNEPTAVIAPVVTQTDITCNGANNGVVTISSQSSGGTGPYTYSIDGINYVNFVATPFTGLAANTYSVLGQDANGCISPASNNVTVNEPTAVTAPVVTETDITCNGANNGIVTISSQSSGGVGPYTYSIDGINYVNFVATPFTGLSANTYSVLGKDANGCISSASNNVTVNEPTVVAAPVVTETDITCNGANNGIVTISSQSSGGVGPYTYSIDGINYVNFAATPFTGLAVNTYSVLGQDAHGCISPASNSVTVNQPSAVIAPVISETDVTCTQQGTVTINSQSTGGVGPYTYSIDGINYVNFAATPFTGLAANTYSVLGQDATGCISPASNSVTVNNSSTVIAPVISATDITCNGANNGIVTISFQSSGGTGPYTYSIDGINYVNFATTPFTGLTANTYSVLGKDASGCISAASNSVTVNNPTAVTAPVVTETDITCNGAGNGIVTISSQSSGGVGPYTYSIDGINYVNFAATPFTGLAANTYSVLGQDANGCISPASNNVTVNEPTVVAAPAVTETDITCNGANNGIVTISSPSSGGVGPYTYSIDGINYVNFAATPFTGLSANTYSITGKDGNGCISPASNSVTVSEPAAIIISPTGGTYNTGQTINLTANASNGNAPYTYSWTGPSYSSGNVITDPTSIPNATVGMTGTYDVTVTDNHSCSVTGTTTVTVNNVFNGSVWTGGNNSSDWNDPLNWIGGVPVGGCASNVEIQNVANEPELTGNENLGAVQLDASAGLIIDNGVILSVCGDWTGASNSKVTGAGGVVQLNGLSSQTITGTTQFQELQISNTNNVSLAGGASLSIMGFLDLTAGNFDVSAGTITFLSTSVTQCGIIDNFSPGNAGTLTGNIHAQRFYGTASAIGYDQHFLGSPVHNVPFSQLGAAGTPGYLQEANDGCDEAKIGPSSPWSSVLRLDETHGAGCTTDEWYAEVGGNATDAVGYAVTKPGISMFTLNGAANLDPSYSLNNLVYSNWDSTTTIQGHTVRPGWYLVSNPYLAPLNITSIGTNMDNQVQVWIANDDSLQAGLGGNNYSGSYQAYVAGQGPVYIAPFQAFMVHVTSINNQGTFTINATDRVRTPTEFYSTAANTLKVTAQNTSTGLIDATTVAFNQNATTGFDPSLDAAKPSGALSRQTLYTTSGNPHAWYSINTLQSIAQTGDVPMGFEPGNTASYSFSFDGINTFDPTVYIYLEDLQSGTPWWNLRNGNYNCTADSSDTWQRFVLHFTPPAVINTTDAACNSQGAISITQPGTANWNYTLVNSNNVAIATGVLNQNSPLSVNAVAGTYTLTLVDNNNYTVAKTIQVGGAQVATASFELPAATVPVQTEVQFTSTAQNAASYSWNFGDGTILNGVANPDHTYVTPGVYEVSLTVTSASSCEATSEQSITVTDIANGINTIPDNGISMWSNENKVYVDFSQISKVDATIKIFNVLGQELSNDRFTGSTVYQKQLDDVEAAVIIVTVKMNDRLVSKKLFINNIGK